MLLGPVTKKLAGKRLLVVADGALQYLPFAALPIPGRKGELVPMMVEHEIISLPSASALAALRRESRDRKPSAGVAVLADPVFEPDDPRLSAGGRSSDVEKAAAAPPVPADRRRAGACPARFWFHARRKAERPAAGGDAPGSGRDRRLGPRGDGSARDRLRREPGHGDESRPREVPDRPLRDARRLQRRRSSALRSHPVNVRQARSAPGRIPPAARHLRSCACRSTWWC